jgi:antitoxin component of RelBE/YafQ-DinJ toxin-antitoxin module
MSKETLNLSVEKHIKEQAKRIAKNRGISVSKLFEEAVEKVEEPTEEYTPPPGSAVERIMNAIPESEKLTDYDYKKLKEEALREKYGF